jgi:hypothetical protein
MSVQSPMQQLSDQSHAYCVFTVTGGFTGTHKYSEHKTTSIAADSGQRTADSADRSIKRGRRGRGSSTGLQFGAGGRRARRPQ